MRSTSTGERFNPLAAASPPKPPPTITTSGAFVVIFQFSDLRFKTVLRFLTCRISVSRLPFRAFQRFPKVGLLIFQAESSNRFSLKQSHVPVITTSATVHQVREEKRNQQNHHDEAACTAFPRTRADRSWRGWTRLVEAISIEPSFAGVCQHIIY
jgi:hypothetical protein